MFGDGFIPFEIMMKPYNKVIITDQQNNINSNKSTLLLFFLLLVLLCLANWLNICVCASIYVLNHKNCCALVIQSTISNVYV